MKIHALTIIFLQIFCVDLRLKIIDDSGVAGKVNKKLKYRRKAETLKQALGAVVTQLRLEKDWSQGQLAIKSVYSLGWVNKFESGKVNPTLELVIAFADTFKLRLPQFFARAERKHLKNKPASIHFKKKI